ncbi:MAG: SUMF1/EgtB/PvdO family nonheme iron enzyme [Fibrobacter sp.]|nr:SUMF1/EgtB/PvdO family nonheme iron enzyme [Fibrobacter sp.]
MTFSRLLPLLLLVPALTMADDDQNFKLLPENFKVGSILDQSSSTAIKLDSAVAFSQEPVFPLQANRLYLRQKKSVKEYLWFSGEAKPEEYKKLHAFNLKENHLGVREVVGLRLYASRQHKAFQDEADIYFDSENIYSSRVAKLLFMKNGKWQSIKESAHPGMVQIQSDEKNLEIVSYNASLKNGARAIYPAKEGVYMFAFSAPDKLPYVDIGTLKAGDVLVFKVEFPTLDSSAAISVNLNVSQNQVDSVRTLEDAEKLYDKYSAEVDKNVQRVDTTEFSKAYPVMQTADSLGLTEKGTDYRNYVSHYNLKRNEAKKIWRSQKLSSVNAVSKAIRAKLDSLQALPVQVNLMPSAIETISKDAVVKAVEPVVKKADSVAVVDTTAKVADSTAKAVVDSTAKVADTTAKAPAIDTTAKAVAPTVNVAAPAGPIDTLKLTFGSERDRIHVIWKGVVEDYPMDSLVAKMKANDPSLVTTLFLVNNKPVWVYKEGDILGRYQYRFDKVAFRIGMNLYVGKGEFILPSYVSSELEVRDWLATKDLPSSSVASSSSTSKDSSGSDKIIEHASRGVVAIIDSGSFRFRGKVVSMSPFAIHTTEVTQEFFKKTMETIDSASRYEDRSMFKGPKKPVQGITWEKAQYFCKILGGELPTEAQWEFAGRAGANEGTLWTSDDVMSVNKYAVFAENSMKLGKQDSAYGPHDVATKTPNALGLYDMSGNVAEWTLDNYFAITFKIEDSNPTGSYLGTNKVLKGGSWKDKAKNLNMTARDDEDPRYWADYIGFRCAFPLHRIIPDYKK